MDSKGINKLIRSEIWPLLRQLGFSHFDSRSAFAYQDAFINVVNFQSFNSYLAGTLGCTTYSFAVRLGVYVVGQPGGDRVPRDQVGRLIPHEYECYFRSELRKRTPVDGFARDEIFYFDPDGHTVGPCFNELRELVIQVLPNWFERHNNLHVLLDQMNATIGAVRCAEIDTVGNPGSYSWNTLKSLLALLKHEELPNERSASDCLESLNRMIGTILDFSTIQSGRPGQETYALEVRELWDRLGKHRPIAYCPTGPQRGSLGGEPWEPSPHPEMETRSVPRREKVSARKHLWPMLKRVGFSEFTDRLAHRVSKDLVEVVEFLPMDASESKAWSHPQNLFRVGLGIFWTNLREEKLFRTNRVGTPRPTADECHVSNWLTPGTPVTRKARTAFDSAEQAATILTDEGLPWLETLRSPMSAVAMFGRNDWELFWCYPMMRGYGAKSSARRLVYLAQLSSLLNGSDESDSYLGEAEAAVDPSCMEHQRPHYREWIKTVRKRLATI